MTIKYKCISFTLRDRQYMRISVVVRQTSLRKSEITVRILKNHLQEHTVGRSDGKPVKDLLMSHNRVT